MIAFFVSFSVKFIDFIYRYVLLCVIMVSDGDDYMRVISSKSKNAESFYLNLAYTNEHGKSTSRTYKKLGTLKELSKKLNTDRDGVVAWCNEQCRIETAKYKEENEIVYIPLHPSKTRKKDDLQKLNCGYLYLQSLCSQLRIDNIIRNIKSRHDYKYDLNAILTDLIYARILSPSSKCSTYDYCQKLIEKPTYKMHDIYRALSVLSTESDYIQSELYRNSNFIHPRNKKVLYYDCTNFYFEIEQDDNLRKYGKSKENRPNPIVGLGLFMDEDGIPLAFDIHPGNQNEQLTLKPLEQKVIRDYECAEFIYCSDSGLASKNNKLFSSTNGRSYIITQSLKKLKKEDRNTALNPTQFRLIGSNKFIDLTELDETEPSVYNSVYYKILPHTVGNQEEMIVVTYSPKYKAYQSKIRQGQIDRAVKAIQSDNVVKKTKSNQHDPARFIKTTSLTKDGEVADKNSYELNHEAIENEKQYDGFYAVSTNLDDDIEEIINVNKKRWMIEECFRIMKTDFEARPVYLQKEERIKAHFLTCFISLLVYRLLEVKLEKKYTTDEIIVTLRDMEVIKREGYGYESIYDITDLTNDLNRLFGFRTDTEIIKKAKMRSIIRSSKETKTLR